jgi:hypothetical protein
MDEKIQNLITLSEHLDKVIKETREKLKRI